MKVITKHIILFAGLFSLYTIVFRALLSYSLSIESYSFVWIYAAIYALMIFITAWNLGKADNLKSFIFDAGLKFHVVTFFFWGLISELWFILGFGSTKESIKVVHITLLIWVVFLLFHIIIYLILRKHTIKGIQRSDIFD